MIERRGMIHGDFGKRGGVECVTAGSTSEVKLRREE